MIGQAFEEHGNDRPFRAVPLVFSDRNLWRSQMIWLFLAIIACVLGAIIGGTLIRAVLDIFWN